MAIVARVKLPYYGTFDKACTCEQEARNWIAGMLAGARLGRRGEFGNVPRLNRNNHYYSIKTVDSPGILALM